ncbi:MAG: hypothetical protein AABN95_08470 [Acidobacteriota bacterium]
MSHPNPGDYNIGHFTGVKPFPLEQWGARLERPTVTFIWRDDRTWQKARLKLRRLLAQQNPPQNSGGNSSAVSLQPSLHEAR